MRRHLLYGICLAALLTFSCEKVSKPDLSCPDNEIGFYIHKDNFTAPLSKTIIENTSVLENLALPLYVTDMINPESTFNNHQVTYDAQTGFWKSSETWENQNYSFYAYTYSEGNNGTGAEISVVNGKDSKNFGYYVNLYEPASYSHDDNEWADFLMSYRTTNIDGAQKPLVEFQLERITAGVELFISAPEGSSTDVTEIHISDVIRAAAYTMNDHAVASQNSQGIRNVWRYSYLESPVTYSRSEETLRVKNITEEDDKYDDEFRMMRFITVPQSVSSTLTIVYKVLESNDVWTEHSVSIDLDDLPVKEWRYGYKTRYYINLDSSIEVEGTIAEWTDVEYVEGVFLPKLPNDD